jgi:hypothetical protein
VFAARHTQTDDDSMTYAEHRQREREYRQERWLALSPKERERQAERREAWCWNHFVQLSVEHVVLLPDCIVCATSLPGVHCWPTFLLCLNCGFAFIKDCWLPDGIERVFGKTATEFRQLRHDPSVDHFDYPLGERLRDLRGENDEG